VVSSETFPRRDGADEAPSWVEPGDPWALTDSFVTQLGIRDIRGTQYVECRLGDAREQVDYLCALSRSGAGSFHEALKTYATAHALAQDSVWTTLFRLLRQWDDGDSPIHATAPGIWLEFDDVVRHGQRPTTPSICVGLVAGYRFDQPFNPPDFDRDFHAASSALRALGVDPSEPVRSVLSACFADLPRSGRWVHLSVMLGRRPSAIKLYGVMNREALAPYLRKIGWAGDYAAIARLMAEAYGPDLVGDEVFLDLNLENFRDEASCSLGLAVSQQHVVRGPDRDPRRTRILERWASLGLAERGRSQRILEGLRGRADVFRPDGRILDLKLVWQAGRGATAKAYLGSHRAGSVL
jgi:hypothetical protein